MLIHYSHISDIENGIFREKSGGTSFDAVRARSPRPKKKSITNASIQSFIAKLRCKTMHVALDKQSKALKMFDTSL